MTDTLTPVLTADWADEQSWKLATYERNGGYRAMRKALTMAAVAAPASRPA
jgi:NADH-quinone oxidoreductase subunit F